MLAGALALTLVACSGGAPKQGAHRGAPMRSSLTADPHAGKLIAGGNFTPTEDAYSFANFAPSDSEGFSVDDAVALFGAAAVCLQADGECTPNPQAQAWMETVQDATRSGVCEGMVVSAQDRWAVDATPDTASLGHETTTLSTINRLFATQFLPDVQRAAEAHRSRPISSLVKALRTGLGDPREMLTVGLYTDEGGHAVLPFELRRISDTRYHAVVYDPNWPSAARVLELDTAADTWRYAATTADQIGDTGAWRGGPDRIDAVPLRARTAPFSPPFKGAGRGRNVLVTVTARGEWALRDGDRTVASAASQPGDAGIVAVGRDGGQREGWRTIVVELPSLDARFQATGPARMAVQQADRVLQLRGRAATVTADSTTLGAELARPGAVTVSSDAGRAQVTFSAPGTVALTGTEQLAVTQAGDQRALTLPGPGFLTRIDADGTQALEPIAAAPATVRAEAPGTVATTTTTTTAPTTSTTVAPASATSLPTPRFSFTLGTDPQGQALGILTGIVPSTVEAVEITGTTQDGTSRTETRAAGPVREEIRLAIGQRVTLSLRFRRAGAYGPAQTLTLTAPADGPPAPPNVYFQEDGATAVSFKVDWPAGATSLQAEIADTQAGGIRRSLSSGAVGTPWRASFDGLTPGRTYQLRFVALNGTVASQPNTSTVTLPPAPPQLSAQGAGSTAATVHITGGVPGATIAISATGITDTGFRRGAQLMADGTGAATWTLDSVVPGQQYRLEATVLVGGRGSAPTVITYSHSIG